MGSGTDHLFIKSCQHSSSARYNGKRSCTKTVRIWFYKVLPRWCLQMQGQKQLENVFEMHKT